jgi:hypothetical protein
MTSQLKKNKTTKTKIIKKETKKTKEAKETKETKKVKKISKILKKTVSKKTVNLRKKLLPYKWGMGIEHEMHIFHKPNEDGKSNINDYLLDC